MIQLVKHKVTSKQVTFDELVNELRKSMEVYCFTHKDFSYKLKLLPDQEAVEMTTLNLQEHVN